jgi:hypothetical protein
MIRLAIDQVVVEGAADGEVARSLLERALRKLGERLSRHPEARFRTLASRAIELLEIEGVQADELFGPGGEELLADELYRALMGRIS